MKKFIDLVVVGEASIDDVDDYVEKWHQGDSEEDLHDYLGLTWNEYIEWVAHNSYLQEIIDDRMRSKR